MSKTPLTPYPLGLDPYTDQNPLAVIEKTMGHPAACDAAMKLMAERQADCEHHPAWTAAILAAVLGWADRHHRMDDPMILDLFDTLAGEVAHMRREAIREQNTPSLTDKAVSAFQERRLGDENEPYYCQRCGSRMESCECIGGPVADPALTTHMHQVAEHFEGRGPAPERHPCGCAWGAHHFVTCPKGQGGDAWLPHNAEPPPDQPESDWEAAECDRCGRTPDAEGRCACGS